MTYLLRAGDSLQKGQSLTLDSYAVNMRNDGNVNLTAGGKERWNAGVNGGVSLTMLPSGNLVLVGPSGETVWQSNTNTSGAWATLAHDGRFAVVTQAGSGVKTLWEAGKVKTKAQLFPDPIKAAKALGHVATDVVHGKIKKAGQDIGRATSAIAGSQIIQAAFPGSAIPAAILAGAVSGGPKGALEAAHQITKNPELKGVIAAVGVVLPPLAPVSAGAIAGLEASGRLIDGIQSNDPKQVAMAALQIASTSALAADGNPGAQATLDTMNKVQSARDLAGRLAKSDPAAVSEVQALTQKAAAGTPAAKAALATFHAVTAREALRGKLPQSALNAVHAENPALLSMVSAGVRTPSGVRLGDFSLLKTGRLLLKGQPIVRLPSHYRGP